MLADSPRLANHLRKLAQICATFQLQPNIASQQQMPPRPLAPARELLSRLPGLSDLLLIYYFKCELAPWH